ncbi:N,N-dimethylformamidase beta subunit family domain-containing protein [Streptomyces malaysiensis]|uniref:N,N-dimethylformamidase beta subunit family domain-containing protein n=1 Tax=Streptomyces malaysiensis TaxID=92644 RepID=UPI003558D323
MGFPTDAPYVVLDSGHWLFAGTGVDDGDSFDHLVGVEYDRVTPGDPTPAPLRIIAHSPWSAGGGTATRTPRTTRWRAAPGSSPRGRCAGWRP